MSKDPKIVAIERFFSAYAAHDLAGLASVLAEDIEWTIPGRHPLSGTKRGISEVVAFFDQLAKAGFMAQPIFLGANEEYVVDVHRGWSTQLDGKVDTTWALVWRFGSDGKVHQVLNLSADQAQMDAFCWANYPLKAIPARLATNV
jgi:ketosteroid isomerase-like protein